MKSKSSRDIPIYADVKYCYLFVLYIVFFYKKSNTIRWKFDNCKEVFSCVYIFIHNVAFIKNNDKLYQWSWPQSWWGNFIFVRKFVEFHVKQTFFILSKVFQTLAQQQQQQQQQLLSKFIRFHFDPNLFQTFVL